MFFRFLIVGGAGFLIDVGVTCFFVYYDIDAWLARLPAIACAVIFTWLANRYFTYSLKTARSTGEAIRYMLVATVMAIINYSIYLGMINIRIAPVIAIIISTTLQIFVSFYAYRYFAFKLPVN